MGYARALLLSDRKIEEGQFEEVQRKASRKSLWGSVGRTLGGLVAMAVTGGTATPLVAAMMAGGASFLGGAIGARAAYGGRDLEAEAAKGKFFKSERKDLESDVKDVGAFGTQNILASLKAGATAGITQKAKLLKDARAAKLADPSMSDEAFQAISSGKGMDFEGSLLGKGLEKRASAKIGRELIQKGEASIGTGSPSLPGRGEFVPGEITSKIEKAGASTGMGREFTPDLYPVESIPFSPSKVSPTPTMDPMFNPKSLVESYLAPMEQYEMMDGEMVKHAGRGMKMPDWWKRLSKGKESGLSTVIGS